ncbi:MAG: OmpA family protein [Sedimentisphaerales bacterium]
MRTVNKKAIILLTCLASAMFFPSCTDWKKKYKALNVEHENLKGLLDREKSEKGQLNEQVSQSKQTIEELQKQIAERKQTAAQATGFGEGYDVTLSSKAGTVTITLSDKILFDPGKATLKKSSSTELDHIKSVLQSKYSGRQIDVVGHTDSEPIKKSPWKDNMQLSTERANVVVRYLTEHGIPKDNIRAVGRGDSHPVASNATAGGRAKNRRVEIVVHMK